MRYTIIRPTVVFGREDILINNIAFLLRKMPLFLIPGDGRYRLQPVYVEDLASIAVEAGRATENATVDAVGPERFSFEELVSLIRATVGSRARLVHARPGAVKAATRILGWLFRDVVLTEEELSGLMAGLLVSHDAPVASTQLSAWLAENAAAVGRRYASEVRRHYRS